MTKLVDLIKSYAKHVIRGFESGLYNMLAKTNHDRIKLLCSNQQYFITIFRDLHENYYTTVFNSIVMHSDPNIIKTFDEFRRLSNHSYRCILNILANLIISVHFNLDRKKLDCSSYNAYMKSLSKEIWDTVSVIDIAKLFDHECNVLQDNDLKVIPEGEKFITIKMTHSSNGIEKEINSFVV